MLSINRSSSASTPHRLVVTAPNWLGDAVMSLPLVGLCSALSEVELTLMAPAYTARVFADLDGIDELIVYPRRRRAKSLGWQRRLLRRLRPSAAIMLPPSFSSAVPAFLARVPVRAGYRTDGRRWLLSEALPAGGMRSEHVSENYLQLGRAVARRLGLTVPDGFAVPRIRIRNHESERLDQLLDSAGAPRQRFALYTPGAAYGSAKAWPESAGREAIRQLAASLPVILAGGPSDRAAAARLSAGLSNVFDLAGRTSLGEFLALVERAGVLIANDSGPPHAAGSLGTPAVVIFGSTSPVWTKPLGEAIEVVRRPVLCSPCFLRECPTRLECFSQIDPSEVVSRALQLVKKEVDISHRGG